MPVSPPFTPPSQRSSHPGVKGTDTRVSADITSYLSDIKLYTFKKRYKSTPHG